MIYIEKNSTNKVVLTLWESVTIETPFYAFKFTNQLAEEVIFLAADTSDAVERYNLFNIVEQATGLDPLTGVVYLAPTGQWIAEIYETATESLVEADWGALLQTEMVVVNGTDTSIDEIYR